MRFLAASMMWLLATTTLVCVQGTVLLSAATNLTSATTSITALTDAATSVAALTDAATAVAATAKAATVDAATAVAALADAATAVAASAKAATAEIAAAVAALAEAATAVAATAEAATAQAAKAVAALASAATAGVVTAGTATLGAVQGAVLMLTEPRPDEVIYIEFMTESDNTNPKDQMSQYLAQEKSMVYNSDVILNKGSPSSQAAICTWVYLKLRRQSNTLLVVYAKNDTSREDFTLVSLLVYSSNLTMQTISCTVTYNYIVELRKWIHVCVAMNATIRVYADGELVSGSSSCAFEGTAKLTSNLGKVSLGANPMSVLPMSGKLADVRFYVTPFSDATAKAVKSFDTSVGDYIKVLKQPNIPSSLPSGLEMNKMMKTELTAAKQTNVWMRVSEEITFEEAVDVCSKFGGALIDVPKVKAERITGFVVNKLQETLFEFWVNSSGKDCLLTTVSPAAVQIAKQDCLRKCQVICSLPVNVPFKVIGLDDNPVAMSLTGDNKFTFDAEYDYRLEFNETTKQFYVIMVSNKAVLASTKKSLVTTLMGRHTWKYESIQDEVTLTLTSCNTSQFTCSNGHCINIFDICNSKVDCEDYSDEQLCNRTQARPSYYDSNLSGEDNLQLGLNATLERIQSINIDDGTIQIEMSVEATWKDSRVVFHNLHPAEATLIPTDDVRYYWQPNIVLSGVITADITSLSMALNPDQMFVTAQQEGKPTTFMSQEVLEHQGASVDITHSKEQVLTMLCSMDLYIYPFDVQTCNMKLDLEGLIQQDAEWVPARVTAQAKDGLSLQLYEFMYFKQTVSTDSGNPVVLELRVMRLYGSHILITFLPCVVLHIIGLTVFTLPLDDLTNRLTISISCFIVMGAFFTQISSMLPVSASPKMIDIWMFAHVFLLAVVFFTQIILHKLYIAIGQGPEVSNYVTPIKDPTAWLERKGEETEKFDDEEDLTFPATVNKWTAIISVVVYAVFVVAFFSYVLIERANKSK